MASPAESNQESGTPEDGKPTLLDRPRICAIDLPDDCVEAIKSKGFIAFAGTLGPLVEVPNVVRAPWHQCLPNSLFPPNLHEYDIVIIDLQNPRTVAYVEKDHTRTWTKGPKQFGWMSCLPATIFDPRALASKMLEPELSPLMHKESILVVFAAEYEDIEYQPIEIDQDGSMQLDPLTYSLYHFCPHLPPHGNLAGRDTTVVFQKPAELSSLLKQHNDETAYEIIFHHPTRWVDHTQVKDPTFIPLMEAGPDNIVAFAHVHENSLTLFFPHIRRKVEFLTDLLGTVLPDIKPSLFPHSTRFAWLQAAQYRLPNEESLLQQKAGLQAEYDARLSELDSQISANCQEYGFLHDLLKQSGAELVKTVENYLRWLGFDNVVNVDETYPDLKEEDLRIETERGLLVIEVKGIGRTSTDSECSQISKIRYRRLKERGTFDVFGLYLVNHQRYLPPDSRTNPPFNETQIEDARNDERGLLTTYDLFKLYFNVTKGFISEEDARNALFQNGLVRFQPSEAVRVPDPIQIHYKGDIIVFCADGLMARKGMSVILSDTDRWRSAKILEIQINKVTVEEADSGKVGIRLSEKVSKGTELWLRYDT